MPMSIYNKHDITMYYKIKLEELKPDKLLPCDIYIYLKKNQRVVLLRKKNFILEQSKYAYFNESKFDQLYVKNEDKNKFLKHNWDKEDYLTSTFILHDESSSQIISAAIAKEIINVIPAGFVEQHSKGFKIISGVKQGEEVTRIKGVGEEKDDFYSISGGKNIGEEKGESFLRVVSTKNEFFNHAQSVSKFSIMFAQALGFDNPTILQNLALAGLFHDIGYSKLPPEIRSKNVKKLSREERDLYESHPELALEVFKETEEKNKIIQRIILEHHENFDGTGFPNRLKGSQIHELSRILAIANELDHLLMKEPSYNHSIKQALEKIRENNRKDSQCKLDPVILNKVINSLLTIKELYDVIGKPSIISPTL